MIKIKSSTAKSPEAYVRQIETEIPLVTEVDYGKWLMLIPLKPENDNPHFVKILNRENPVKLEHIYPSCLAGSPSHEKSLMSVYNIEDDIIQILRVPNIYYPGSLRTELDRFLSQCFLDRLCHFDFPFTISSLDHLPDGNLGEGEYREGPRFKVNIRWWLGDARVFAAREKGLFRFLEVYRAGDLAIAAKAQEPVKELNNGLKPINIAGYIRLAS